MTSLADVLREALDRAGRAPARLVAREFDTIDAALKAGVSYEDISEGLAKLGVQMPPRAVKDLVYRLRRRRRLAASPTGAAATAVPGGNTVGSGLPPPVRSRDPQALTDILNTPPDLDALARRLRDTRRKLP